MKLPFTFRPPSKAVPFAAPGNLCWSDKIIIFTLFYYFLSYPFFLRNMMGVLYPMALYGLLVVTVLVCAIGRMPISAKRLNCGGSLLQIGVLLYLLYFFVQMVVSFCHFDEPIVVVSEAYEIRDILFVLIIFFLLSDRGTFVSLRLYVKVLTWCSFLGLLLILLNYLQIIQPITEVSLDNLPGGLKNQRLFFGIGYIWPNTWIGSVIGLERLQSFSDEAGTFAFAVLPAIFLAAYWKMKGRLLIMSVALIFTFSVGAISAWLFFQLPVSESQSRLKEPSQVRNASGTRQLVMTRSIEALAALLDR